MIGIVIPGLPIITGGPITSNTVVSDVNNPGTINNITLFQTDMLPNDYDVFYTGWSLNPNVNYHQQIKICVKLEKLVDVRMAYEQKIKYDINQEFAKRVAKNLYNYLDSFNQNQDPNKQILVVPLNSLESWYDKFLNKYKIDPNFLMKTDI